MCFQMFLANIYISHGFPLKIIVISITVTYKPYIVRNASCTLRMYHNNTIIR